MYSTTISDERLKEIDIERTNTMKDKTFQQWCKELRISALYVDETLHRENRDRVMNMFHSDEWINYFILTK
jgi:hypothetical protein